jgi:hypothetical protein
MNGINKDDNYEPEDNPCANCRWKGSTKCNSCKNKHRITPIRYWSNKKPLTCKK